MITFSNIFNHFGLFKQLWVIHLDSFWNTWTTLSHFKPFCNILTHWNPSEHFWSIWILLNHFQTIWRILKQFHEYFTKSYYFKQMWTIVSHLDKLLELLFIKSHFEPSWNILSYSEPLWTNRSHLKHVESFLITLKEHV